MKTLLKVLVALFALGLSASAAYFSVLGLTKMFAGAVMGTAIVCSFIEGSKLVIASVLHQFGKKLSWFIKGMLTLFLLLAMVITSMGVYGYLTNAFQSTANQIEIIEGQTKVIQLKRDRYQESLDSYVLEKKDLSESITELTKGLSNNVIQYKDKETGEIITTTSSSTRKVLESQLNDAKVQRDTLAVKIESLTDSVTKLDFQVLDLNSNEELAAEVGPLKFISELSGYEMNVIVNFLVLILVFIVDPMAIVLVIVFNKIGKDKEVDVKMSVPEGKEFNTPYPIKEQGTTWDNDISEEERIDDIVDELFDDITEVPEPENVIVFSTPPPSEEYTEVEQVPIDIKENPTTETEEKEPEPNEALKKAYREYKREISENIEDDITSEERKFYDEHDRHNKPHRIG